MHQRLRHPLAAYGLAVLATAVSLLIRWPLRPVLRNAVPQMTFFPAVMIAAYFGGFWPGFVATLLSAFAANYFVAGQPSGFHFSRVNEVAALSLFVLVGTIISGLCESLHRVRRHLVAEERRRAEDARRETEERFRQLVENIHEVFWMSEVGSDRMLYVTPGYEEITGRTCQSLYERPESRIESLHPDDRARVAEYLKRRREGVFTDMEFRIVRPDGSIRWVRNRTFPIKDENGQVSRVAGLMEDITDRKRNEEALRENEERFRGTFDNAAVGIAHGDLEGRYVRVNQKFCDIVGYSREELLGRTFRDITFGEDLDGSDGEFNRLVRGQVSSYQIEKRLIRKDGAVAWVNASVSLRIDTEGKEVHTIAVIEDISERRRLEAELRESEHRWRSITEALPQLVWTALPDGACDYFSTQWTQYTGVPASELLGWQWMATLHPDDREPTRQFWTDSVADRHAYDVEYRVRRFDGEYRWFKTRGVPIRDSDGRIFKWFGTCTDITTSKQLEDELRQANERLDLAVRGSDIALWENDMPDGDFLRGRRYYVNAWEQLGYQRSEIPPDAPLMSEDRVHPDERPAVQEAIRKYLVGQTDKFELEHRLRHKDGSYHWVLTRGVAVRDAAGKPIRFVGSAVDITDRKRLEVELRLAKETAESANRAKDEFLANVSHEIRTPMNAILGMTELVLDTPLSDDQRQSLRTVKSAADNLLGIINDLLDFSKIEAGKLKLDPAAFSLRAAVSDTVRALAVRAHRKGLELVCNVQQDVPDVLVGDAGRLRQVLLNLVGNAIKFTEKGEVIVQVDAAGDESAPTGGLGIRFTVRDTGIGIPREKQSTIFRAFEQEDTSTTRKYGGTGLGLTISAQLVTLMGGSIDVQSELGRGSTFSFVARFGRQADQQVAVAPAPPVLLRNLRVLVVDDNASNRHIMERWLRGWQMEPTSVADGMAAMDALWHGVAIGKPHALLLLDARMPDTDGLTLAAKIRERAELSDSRIILLTSGDRLGELARFRELHVEGHLLKPVQQDELLETIYSIMSRTNGGETGPSPRGPVPNAAPGPPPTVAPLRVLVAEDSEFNAQLMEKLLLKRGHAVQVVSNGQEALARANAAEFDLLLLDLHMPELDGLQVIRSIREHEQVTGSHLPVIALTARSRKEDRELCLAAGMDGFLAKPVQTDELWETIDRIVGAPAPNNDRTIPPLVDPRVLLAACGEDADILKSICNTFRARLPDHLTAVQEAIREHDTARLREAAHKLFGMVSAFSTLAGNAASELEDLAAQGRLEEAQPLVRELETMVPQLLELTEGISIDLLRAS